MTTTSQAHGGGAQPASIDTSGKVTGGTALRVYGFDTPEAAHAAGYVCEGGPAMSVALITDAQLASGAWKAEGDPSATIIYTAPSSMPVEGGYAVPIYVVNGWGSTPAPAPGGPVALLDLEADTLTAGAVAAWADQSGNHNDFTQATGAAQPTAHLISGIMAVTFDAVDDSMAGGNFADNLTTMTIIAVASNSSGGPLITKIEVDVNYLYSGWEAHFGGDGSIGLSCDDGLAIGNPSIVRNALATSSGKSVLTFEKLANAQEDFHLYINGVVDATPTAPASISQFSTSEVVRLGVEGGANGVADLGYGGFDLYAIRFYSPALSSTDRAAVEAELATRYGVTL